MLTQSHKVIEYLKICLKEISKLNIINLILNTIFIKILAKKQIYNYPNFSGSAPKNQQIFKD